MDGAASLIPELENALLDGPPERRVEILRRVTSVFIEGASGYEEDHVQVFDEVLSRLIQEIEAKARAELSRRLAPFRNAPIGVVRQLAQDDDISVAGPVLESSERLTQTDLGDVARRKSQSHLLAISGRTDIGEIVTELLARRGNQQVARKLAENHHAKISEATFHTLAKRAQRDGALAEKVASRSDIPARVFRDLVMRANEVVRSRLLASANHERKAEIQRVLSQVAEDVGTKSAPLDYLEARTTVLNLHESGMLDEATILDFAESQRYEETAVALSVLCGVPTAVVDRGMADERPDPVLVLTKAAGLHWPTVQAIISVRPGKQLSTQRFAEVSGYYRRLSRSTARRVVRFWAARKAAGEGAT
jgi:uncharacterized protein (DUF2336 family)